AAEFCLVTGDQSLSEAISHEKIFLYQIMNWKGQLWENLLKVVKEALPEKENSKLYQFLKFQDIDSPIPLKEFKQFIFNNKTAILEDVKALRQFILDNKNLYTSLPN